MGKVKRLTSFFAILIFLLLVPVSVFAQEAPSNMRSGENVSLGADEVINSDFFAGGNRVEISGTVNGDVYASGGQIIIDGVVNGDLLVAGGTINISGEAA